MKKNIIIVLVIFCCAFAKACTSTSPVIIDNRSEQQFVSHQVKKGETLDSIAKMYLIKKEDIIKLNPDTKNGIYEGLVLILPAKATVTTQQTKPVQEDLEFRIHKVKRKEGLYGISKRYGVPQEVIKKYNTRLYSEILQKGDRLRIPINYKSEVVTQETVVNTTDSLKFKNGFIIHNVVAKETKYGIARKYGITILELERLNPQIKDGLAKGAVLKVPQQSFVKSAIINSDKYSIYEVVKGDTEYTLLRLFEMERDELVKLNPALIDGLKEGMVLVVPKGTIGSVNPDSEGIINTNIDLSNSRKVRLIDSINDFTTKRVAVMLPFGVERIRPDSTRVNERLIKDDRILRLSLDLYGGMLMAVNDAKLQGISAVIDVYDTSYNRKDGAATNARKVENIIRSNNFDDTQAVIGPLLGSNINRVSSLLRSRNIPVISPVSNNVDGNSNIFISKPSDAQLRNKMLSYLKIKAVGKNIVIIADEKNVKSSSQIKSFFPNANIVEPRSGDKGLYLYSGDVAAQLSQELENWVILESNDIPLISSVTTTLNAQLGGKDVILFTTNKGNAYDSDEIQHTHLRNLQFHFPSVNKEYKYSNSKNFINAYEDMYGVGPSDNAIRGYDLMYDTLLRISYANDLYTAAGTGVETDYIENKFRYTTLPRGGYANDAVYLLRYTDDLELEEVPFVMESMMN